MPQLCICPAIVKLHFTLPRIWYLVNAQKHIELNCHFVSEKLEAGDISFSYISSKQQLTGIFTKSLGKKQFTYLRGKSGMINPHVPP